MALDKKKLLKHLIIRMAMETSKQMPENCLVFASAEPFTIATANTEKNWDGTLY